MTVESNPDLPAESPDQQMCQLCQLPVAAAARAAHERGLHHQAARQIAAAALDRWRAHMAADAALRETLEEPLDAENVSFCDICTEAVPATSYARHVTARAHLVSALDGQVFEELVRVYVDEEDLKLLEAAEEKDGAGDGPADKSDANTAYTCHICALKVPSAFKSEHERSVHHRARVALASAAARRTSAFLHQTPIGVPGKRNIKMTELLKSYTGIDLMKKTVEEVVEKEIEVEEKGCQSEVKKRLTAKQYFTDILPYLQYTEALYTLIIDDTEFVTIKNTNGTCMRVHIANFNGVYSNSGDVHCDMKCRMCHGYNQYISYNSELNHDKLHVLSLGHIRHVLTPIDNIHGIRKVNNGQSLCVLCNLFMPDYNIEDHVFNDIHHTANLAEALKLGKNFKESKDDLKIIIYSAPPVDKSNFMRHPVRNYDSVLHHKNNFPHATGLFGGNDSFPQGGNSFPEGGNAPKSQGITLFGGKSIHNTGFGASNASPANTGFGGAPASGSVFGASVGFNASPANAGVTFGSNPDTTLSFGGAPASGSVFGASNASTALGSSAQPESTGFGASPSNKAASFGAQPASVGLFGASSASNVGVSSANTLSFGGGSASTGFASAPANTGSVFGASTPSTNFGATPTGIGFNASPSNTTSGANTNTNAGTTFGGPPKTGTIFGGGGNNTFGTSVSEAP